MSFGGREIVRAVSEHGPHGPVSPIIPEIILLVAEVTM